MRRDATRRGGGDLACSLRDVQGSLGSGKAEGAWWLCVFTLVSAVGRSRLQMMTVEGHNDL